MRSTGRQASDRELTRSRPGETQHSFLPALDDYSVGRQHVHIGGSVRAEGYGGALGVPGGEQIA